MNPARFVLIEKSDFLLPGDICIAWYERSDARERVLSGDKADEFMERYRAAPDKEHKAMLMAEAVGAFNL